MLPEFSRTELLLRKDAMEKLRGSRVAVFGIGGVGGAAAEALVRCGVGTLDLIDNDKFSLSNINRQIIALHSTVGQYKVEAAEKRFKDINPDVVLNLHNVFFSPSSADEFDFSKFDYVIDAIDTVTGKICIIIKAKEANVPVISSMGAGNKLNPCMFEVSDIYKTSVCPLARVMRTELKKRGVKELKVVYSKEPPLKTGVYDETTGKSVPGSISFVPTVAGYIIAGEVVKDLTGGRNG